MSNPGQIESDLRLSVSVKQFCAPLLNPLVSELVYSRLVNLCEKIPEALTSFWVIEIPLNRVDEKVDFLFCVDKPQPLNEFLSGHAGENPSNFFLDSPIYEGFRNFSKAWKNRVDQRDPLELVVNVWLEFDYQDIQSEVPHFSFFFAPKQGANSLEVVNSSYKVFGKLSGLSEPKALYKVLLHCIQQLYNDGWVSQIGRMLARAESGLRLYIQDISKGQMPDYLERIGFLFFKDRTLNEIIDLANRNAKKVNLDIDITDTGVGSKIGIECYFETIEKVDETIDELASRRITVDHKVQKLKEHITSLRPKEEEQFQPFFSHIKLVWQPESKVEAKAYLGYIRSQSANGVLITQQRNKVSI